MFDVAQYHDEWVGAESGTGALKAWYICLNDYGGTYPMCGTVMQSKQWMHKFEDVESTKQRWYCVCCEAPCRTTWGMLVEFKLKSGSTFMLSECSNSDVEDVRAICLEEKLKPKDHLDLWEKIPGFAPMNPEEILRPNEAREPAKTET